MKLLLVFALCGITCCLAGPTCSKKELDKCSTLRPDPRDTEEKELDITCRDSKCAVEMYDRCGIEIFEEKIFPVKGYKKYIDAFCDRSSSLRRKYLQNAKCIGKAVWTNLINTCNFEDGPRKEFCKKKPEQFKCAVDYITEECGKDAGEVFAIAVLREIDPFDCLSSFSA